jgi:hypothetical protein
MLTRGRRQMSNDPESFGMGRQRMRRDVSLVRFGRHRRGYASISAGDHSRRDDDFSEPRQRKVYPTPEKKTSGMEAPLPRPQQNSPMKDRRKFATAALEKFAKGLSSLNEDDEDGKTMPNFNLQSLFSSELDDGAVVLTIPSLDLNVEVKKQQDVLPTLGEHAAETQRILCSPDTTSNKNANNNDSNAAAIGSNDTSATSKPDMAASVFAKAKGSAKDIEDQKAVESVSRKISWTKSTIPYASSAVCANLTRSFKTLLNSRLRAWTLLLLRHSLSTGSNESRSQLLGTLSAKIDIVSAAVTFKTLSLPEGTVGIKPNDSDAVLPLLFEASIKISIQEKQERVVLKAPGTISGNWNLKLPTKQHLTHTAMDFI